MDMAPIVLPFLSRTHTPPAPQWRDAQDPTISGGGRAQRRVLLGEARRVLRTGGYLLVAEGTGGGGNESDGDEDGDGDTVWAVGGGGAGGRPRTTVERFLSTGHEVKKRAWPKQ